MDVQILINRLVVLFMEIIWKHSM